MTGTIAARVVMGAVCDWIGPRLGMSAVLMCTAPCVFGMALANKALDFILLRFGIGFGLSTFVSCQFWTASMFNVKIVGVPRLPLLAHPSCPTRQLQQGVGHVLEMLVFGDNALALQEYITTWSSLPLHAVPPPVVARRICTVLVTLLLMQVSPMQPPAAGATSEVASRSC